MAPRRTYHSYNHNYRMNHELERGEVINLSIAFRCAANWVITRHGCLCICGQANISDQDQAQHHWCGSKVESVERTSSCLDFE